MPRERELGMGEKKSRNRIQDLCFLRFADNACYITLENKLPEDVQLDLQAGTWIIESPPGGLWSYRNREMKIGEAVPGFDERSLSKSGTIGVYNRKKFLHLQAMARHAHAAAPQDGGIDMD